MLCQALIVLNGMTVLLFFIISVIFHKEIAGAARIAASIVERQRSRPKCDPPKPNAKERPGIVFKPSKRK